MVGWTNWSFHQSKPASLRSSLVFFAKYEVLSGIKIFFFLKAFCFFLNHSSTCAFKVYVMLTDVLWWTFRLCTFIISSLNIVKPPPCLRLNLWRISASFCSTVCSIDTTFIGKKNGWQIVFPYAFAHFIRISFLKEISFFLFNI